MLAGISIRQGKMEKTKTIGCRTLIKQSETANTENAMVETRKTMFR